MTKRKTIIVLIICFLFYAFLFFVIIQTINENNESSYQVQNIDYSEMTFEELLDETFLQLTKITSE